MNRVHLLSLLCLPLLGCATTIGLPIEDRTRVYEDDFDTVFEATAHALYAEGYPLFDIDYLGGVIETDELFNAGRGEFSRVLASVSEWDDGTHLLLIYIMEDIYSSVNEALEHCGWEAIRRHSPADEARARSGPHFPANYQGPSFPAFTCTYTVTHLQMYRMPILAKSKARKYYDDLFAKIEASMVIEEPGSQSTGESGN